MDKDTTLDPYADPPAAAPHDTDTPMAAANGDSNGHVNGNRRGRSASRSRSRSRSPRRDRSPRRSSPGGYRSSRRSPPAPRRPPHAPSAPKPTHVLGVFGLSIRTVERQLDDEFSRYGRVEKVTIVYDARTGRSRGFGFIRMSTLEEAAACIEKLNGIEIDGRRLRVDYSVTERPHAATPGEYMGTRRDPDTRYRGSGGRYEGGRDSGRDRDSRRDRDRDPYGGHSYRDREWRDSDRERDRDRDWRDRDRERDRRSPRARHSQSPPRRRKSHSRSPRASGSAAAKDDTRASADAERSSAAPRW